MILMARLEAVTVETKFRYGESWWKKYLQNTLTLQRSIQYVIKRESEVKSDGIMYLSVKACLYIEEGGYNCLCQLTIADIGEDEDR
jgi:hypothetical protein